METSLSLDFELKSTVAPKEWVLSKQFHKQLMPTVLKAKMLIPTISLRNKLVNL